jgi:hypothetical protein
VNAADIDKSERLQKVANLLGRGGRIHNPRYYPEGRCVCSQQHCF